MYKEDYDREEKYRLINYLAESIRKDLGIEVPINDIDEIVAMFGGTVVTDDRKHMFIGLEKTSNTTFNLYVPECHREEDRKLYVAANLGKLLLHTNFLSNHEEYINSNKFEFINDKTVEAINQENFFGGAFLMPYKEYKEEMDKNTEGNTVYTDKIAKHFGVTSSAASQRGKELGLLKRYW